MISLVKSPPNHYDVLGLTPAAGEGEIVFAFARRMSMFGAHRPAEAAQICAAYEVLRNAEKRREYDRSIGLGARAAVPQRWAFSMAQQQWPGFAGPTTAAAAYAPEPELRAQEELEPPAPLEVERGPSLAEKLLKLAEPIEYDGMAELAPRPAVAPEPEAEKLAVEQEAPAMTVREMLASDEEGGYSREPHRRPAEWLRSAMLAGGVVASIGLVGFLARFAMTDDPAAVVSRTTAPTARQIAQTSPPPPVAAPPAVEPQVATSHGTVRPARHASSSSRSARAAMAKVAAVEPTEQAQPVDVAGADPAAMQPEPVRLSRASMPLPDRVVAQTIEKIGYSCGRIASTAAVAGTSGVFQVTCSSGQTYKATPVHGHYRFTRSRP